MHTPTGPSAALPATGRPNGHHHDIAVPRGPLLAIAGLLLAALAAAALGTWQANGHSRSAPTAAVRALQRVHIDDRPDGGLTVRRAGDGQVLQQIEPGAQPFVRGALRALVRERRAQGLGPQAPFELRAHADGRLTLQDTATGRRLDIDAFGPAQSAPFARWLDAPAARQVAAVSPATRGLP